MVAHIDSISLNYVSFASCFRYSRGLDDFPYSAARHKRINKAQPFTLVKANKTSIDVKAVATVYTNSGMIRLGMGQFGQFIDESGAMYTCYELHKSICKATGERQIIPATK